MNKIPTFFAVIRTLITNTRDRDTNNLTIGSSTLCFMYSVLRRFLRYILTQAFIVYRLISFFMISYFKSKFRTNVVPEHRYAEKGYLKTINLDWCYKINHSAA